MRTKSGHYTEQTHRYIAETSLREPAAMRGLAAATEAGRSPGMATPPVQGQFLAFLIRAMNATRALEVGVFTGIGTLWIADAVGPEGRVVACDISDEFPAVGRPFWAEAGVADRIDLRIAPAEQTLRALADEGRAGTFDFAYVDADKPAYDAYFELVLPLLRVGGVVAFDNMLLGGRVADPACDDASVAALRALNARLHDDARVDVSFLPLCDGVYLARKR